MDLEYQENVRRIEELIQFYKNEIRERRLVLSQLEKEGLRIFNLDYETFKKYRVDFSAEKRRLRVAEKERRKWIEKLRDVKGG